jgi:hypothetical protein
VRGTQRGGIDGANKQRRCCYNPMLLLWPHRASLDREKLNPGSKFKKQQEKRFLQ